MTKVEGPIGPEEIAALADEVFGDYQPSSSEIRDVITKLILANGTPNRQVNDVLFKVKPYFLTLRRARRRLRHLAS